MRLACSKARLSHFQSASVEASLVPFGLGCRSLRSGKEITVEDARHDSLFGFTSFVSALDVFDIVANW